VTWCTITDVNKTFSSGSHPQARFVQNEPALCASLPREFSAGTISKVRHEIRAVSSRKRSIGTKPAVITDKVPRCTAILVPVLEPIILVETGKAMRHLLVSTRTCVIITDGVELTQHAITPGILSGPHSLATDVSCIYRLPQPRGCLSRPGFVFHRRQRTQQSVVPRRANAGEFPNEILQRPGGHDSGRGAHARFGRWGDSVM
jgi:hypothetical protein